MSDEPNTAGRERNNAQPLGSRRTAAPDGPDAAAAAKRTTETNRSAP
jgi:hypothetical protein